MKIHFAFQQFPEISQTFVYDQMRHLRKQGHHISVSCKKVNQDQAEYIDADFYDELYVYCEHNPEGTFWGSALRQVLQKSKKQYIAHIAKILSKADNTPDIIVAHFGPNVLVAAELKKTMRNLYGLDIPVAGVFHGYDLSKFLKKNGASKYLEAQSDINLFITISEHWKKQLLEIGIAEEKIDVIRLGVNTNVKVLKPGIKDSPKRILFTGRLVEKKGCDDLIEALCLVHHKFKQVELEIIGNGPLLKDCKTLASDKKLSDVITFSGAMRHVDVLKKLQQADLFVLPSKTAQNGDKEGIPVALMEAMAYGVPVVTTSHSGIPELVENNVSGLLVPENSPEELAAAILKLLNDQELSEQLGQQGRITIENHFDQDVQNSKFESAIKSLVDNKLLATQHGSELLTAVC